MNKQTRFSLVAIIIFGLIALGIVILIIALNLPSQSLVQTGGYECPQGKSCSATPILKCTVQQADTRVILRTNAPNWNQESFGSLGTSVALDTNNDGALESYTRGTSRTGCGKNALSSTNLFKDKNIGIDFIYVDSYRDIHICYSDTQSYEWISGGNVPTSLSRIEGWNEKYEGDLYSCSREVFIDNVKKETLSWTSSSPTPTTGKRGNTYTLSAGQEMSSTGSGLFEVEYEVHDIPTTTCIASNGSLMQMGDKLCITPYSLEKCENVGGKPTLTKQDAIPPQICRNGVISDAYTVIITIPKLVISKSEKINIDFQLKDTPTNQNIDITASIYKGSQYISSKTQVTGNTYLTAGKTSFILDAPLIGYYNLKIAFFHPDGDYSKEYNLQVTEDLVIILTTVNPIQFDNNDIEVSLNSFKSGSPKDLTNFDLEATFNGVKQYQYTTEHPSLGILKFKFPLKNDGILRVRAKGNDETGLWTDWTDYFEITVKKATILISTDFQTDKCTGTLTQSFETRDSTGNLIATQNVVTIDKPLGGTDTISAIGSNGKYQFSYNFAEGGLYVVRITSSNSQLGSSQLNAGQGQIINILTGGACAGGGGGEGINWTLWIVIGGIIIGLGLFVYLVFIRRR